MKCLTDWNSKLLPMMGNLLRKPQEALEAMSVLKERFSLASHCMMPEFDHRTDSVAAFLLRRNRSLQELTSLLPREIRVQAAAAVRLLPELSKNIELHKLYIPKTDYLPLQFPLIPEPSWFAPELNRMIYHTKHRLLFLSFDLYPQYYPAASLRLLAELPNTAYQFSYTSLKDPDTRRLLRHLIRRNAPILFGTELNSIGKACYYELDDCLATAQKYFSAYEYE